MLLAVVFHEGGIPNSWMVFGKENPAIEWMMSFGSAPFEETIVILVCIATLTALTVDDLKSGEVVEMMPKSGFLWLVSCVCE